MTPRTVFAATIAVMLAGQLCAVAYEILVAERFGTGPGADALALAWQAKRRLRRYWTRMLASVHR